MIQISLDLVLAQVDWMALIVIQDKLADPIDIRFFGLRTIAFLPAGDADLIKQFWLVGRTP